MARIPKAKMWSPTCAALITTSDSTGISLSMACRLRKTTFLPLSSMMASLKTSTIAARCSALPTPSMHCLTIDPVVPSSRFPYFP